MLAASGTLMSNASIVPISVVPRQPTISVLAGDSWQSALLHVGVSLPSHSAKVLQQTRLGAMSELSLTSGGRARLRSTFGRSAAEALMGLPGEDHRRPLSMVAQGGI